MDEFKTYLRAGYPLLYVNTHEEDRAINSLSQSAGCYTSYSWDIVGGLYEFATGAKKDINDIMELLQAVPGLPECSILFIKDGHKMLGELGVFRSIKNLESHLKSTDKHIVFVSPVVTIPVELEKDIVLIDFGLPSASEIQAVADKLVKDNKLSIGDYDISPAVGLTLHECENAIARSIVSCGSIDKSILETEKLQAVKKSGLMELYRAVSLTELGGLGCLKSYINSRVPGFLPGSTLPALRGILLAGLPGAGKSLSAKVIASVLDVPLIRLDIASLKGGIVGESERQMRGALKLIDSISPCVVWLDEIEKALGGVQSSNRSDGGTTSAMFGLLLTWMSESITKKYIVATCNDIGDLLQISQGALLRRFDDVFFVDLPSKSERREILSIMNRRYHTNYGACVADSLEGFSGAEIEKVVASSLYDGLEVASSLVKPVYLQNRALIDRAREWARNNARIANTIDEVQAGAVRKLSVGGV